MRPVFSMIGLFLVGAVFLLQTGCPKKVQTTEETQMAQPSGEAPGEAGKPLPPVAEEQVPEKAPGEEILPPSSSQEEMSKGETSSTPSGLEDAFFDFDQWTLRSDAKAVLEKNARWLTTHPGVSIRIEGHCDERGTNEYNLALGERRSKSVRNYLVNLGIDAKRFSVISYGEEKPFCSVQTESCFQENRRAHFVQTGS
ncbi:MAG TPA: peptidoglycan-associated lipoprotein Pal [Nitrospiria bacterium]|nr:peptidoglycan-associated lipoprotein Pal [Nitrospiria bacterium]